MQAAAQTLQAPPGGVIVCRVGVKEPVIMVALIGRDCQHISLRMA